MIRACRRQGDASASSATSSSRESRAHRLTQVSRAFTYASSLKDILHLATDQAAEMLGAEKAILMLTDEQGLLRVRAAYGVSEEVVERFRESFDESLDHAPQGAARRRLARGIHRRAAGRRRQRDGAARGGASRGEGDDAERYADDEWLLSALADQTAAPVENAQLLEALDARELLAENSRLYEAERAARKEAELARMEAESANRAKSEFLANMSHELRTPLNAIAGYVELLDMEIRGPVTQAQREDLARIKVSQRVLLRLVNDVLNFAKLESGHVPVTVKEVNIARCFRSLGAARAAAAHVEGAEFRRRSRARTICARTRIRRSWSRFCSICCRTRSSSRPRRARFACRANRRATSCTIRVTDTGRGIPQEKQDRIFEPFVRVDEGFARKTEGTGLGLAISRNLARAMGGELAVESTPGAGATFTMTLKRTT